MRPGWHLMVGLSGLGTLVVPARPAHAQLAPAGALAVPYLAQSTLLCGGAAVAMIERWWGRRQVFAEEFAHLVRPDEGGIRTTELADAARARGWHVHDGPADQAFVQRALADSMPVLALIAVASERYHYVVVVDWDDDAVTFHDPAVAPHATMDVATFLARWQAAGNWSMLIRPLAGGGLARDAPPPPAEAKPCAPWLARAADAAATGEFDAAATALDTAAVRCPGEPLVRRELAGLRFRQGRYTDAESLIADYRVDVPDDTLAVQLHAALQYLRGDARRALATWNAIGTPRLDLFRVTGREHTRFRVITAASGLRLGSTLVATDLALARRRITDIPAVRSARIAYRPVTGGLAEVDIAIIEEARVPSVPRLAIGAARAGFGGVAELKLGSLAGAGETWDASWRWRSANPEVAVRLDIPFTLGIPGTVGVTGEWEAWRFDGGEPDRRRRAASLDFRSWWTAAIESRVAVRHERWRDNREAISLGLGIGLHDPSDRIGLVVQGERAIAISEHGGYHRATIEVGARSGGDYTRPVLTARLGVTWSGRDTPLGLRPIAGGDAGRAVPLRAHRWDTDDRLSLARIGRSIAHGGVALDHDFAVAGPFTLGAGTFLDLARVSEPASGGTGAWYADAGVGLRLGLPGSDGATLRFDVARGVATDPRWGVSVGLAQRWPLRANGID